MKYTEVVQIVRENAAWRGREEDDYTRDATPSDVEALKRL